MVKTKKLVKAIVLTAIGLNAVSGANAATITRNYTAVVTLSSLADFISGDIVNWSVQFDDSVPVSSGVYNLGSFSSVFGSILNSSYNSNIEAGNVMSDLLNTFEFSFGEGLFESSTDIVAFDSLQFTEMPTTNATPVPSAVWLFGSGLAGLVATRRKKN